MSKYFFIIGGILLFSICFISMWQHEQVHSIINNKAGVESEMIFTMYEGYVPDVGVQQLTGQTREIREVDKYHIQNEIINYNLFTPLIGIMIMLFLGFFYIGEKIGDRK